MCSHLGLRWVGLKRERMIGRRDINKTIFFDDILLEVDPCPATTIFLIGLEDMAILIELLTRGAASR